MKKDKEWLKAQIKDEERELKSVYDNYVPYEKVLIADDVNDLINQLDEPELPVIPQFVAEYIEKSKTATYSLLGSMSHFSNAEDIHVWIRENQETFARAWLDGYTIEKEHYWVVSFQTRDFYSNLDEIAYFKEFTKDLSIRIKPNGRTFKDDREVYKFEEKTKADAVALLIGGEVVEVPNE